MSKHCQTHLAPANSFRAFQWYQELLAKSTKVWGNLNTTNKLLSQIDRQTILSILKPSKITIITWQFEINYILFVEMLNLFKIIFLKNRIFVKENKEYFGLFRNILHGISKIKLFQKHVLKLSLCYSSMNLKSLHFPGRHTSLPKE